MLRVPSLNPMRLRGVAWPELVDAVRPNPVSIQRKHHGAGADPGQIADRVVGHLGIVRTGLDRDVAAGVGGVEIVQWQWRQGGQRGGRRPASPNRSNRVGP